MIAMPTANTKSKPTFVRVVCSIQPYYVLLIGLVPGFSLIAGSLILGVDSLKAVSPQFAVTAREVGYLSALNWSLGYALLLPILFYLMANTLSGLARAMERLHSCDMVRDSNLHPTSKSVLTDEWLDGSFIRTCLMFVFAVVIPVVVGLGEWYRNNYQRLKHPPARLDAWNYDWGLAGIMQPAGHEWSYADRMWNATFDFMAFGSEIILLAFLLAFFISVLDLGRVVPSGQLNERWTLLPDLESRDKRLGFEVFESALENLLGAALVAYLICYLVRLQGAYMASTTASSLADFVSKDILQGIATAGADHTSRSAFASILIHLFDLKDQQVRGMVAWLMSVFIAIFSMTAVVMTVRAAARSAQLNAREALDNGLLDVTPTRVAALHRKLDAMIFWPLGYLKLDVLLFWIIVAVMTLLLYRVGLFVAGIVAFSLFFRLVSKLIKPSKPTSASGATPRGRRASGP